MTSPAAGATANTRQTHSALRCMERVRKALRQKLGLPP
jgi:hypothetical protein